MKHTDVVAAWNTQPALGTDDRRLWNEITDRERIEFALSLAGEVEKQAPVDAWILQEVKFDEAGVNIGRGWAADMEAGNDRSRIA